MRDRKVGVVKGCAKPRCGVVASGARRWITRGDVIGHRTAKCRCALPSRDVASVAIRVRGSQIVIAIDMTLRTSRAGKVEPG